MVSHHPNQISYDSSNSRPNSHHNPTMPLGSHATLDRQFSHLELYDTAHATFDRHHPHSELHLPPNHNYLGGDASASSHTPGVPHLFSQPYNHNQPVYNQFFLSQPLPPSTQYAPYTQNGADYPVLPSPGYSARPGPATVGSLSQYSTMAGHELLPPFQSNVHQQLSQSVYSTPPLYSSPSFEATHVTETQHAHPPAQFAQAYPLSRSGSRDSTASTSAYSHSLTPDTEAYGSVHSSHSDSQTSLATTEVTRTAQHLLHPQERPSAVNQPRQPPYYGHLAAGSPVSYSIPPSTFQPPQVKREYNEDDGNSDEEGSPEPKAERVSPVPHHQATKETAGKRTRAELSGVRTSSRIASMGRTSYADLENGTTPSPTASFNGRLSEPPTEDEEDDFRPQKRTRAPSSKKKAPVRRSSAAPAPAPSQVPQIEPCERSLWALNDTYPQLQKLYPLFYHALNDDLSLNMEAVPLIGTIPSTVTPHEKADRLRAFHHRGRRILAQLDAFTRRCDRRYEGESVRWPEIADGVRVAIRDVRRKAVERCENYKYTRRDILDKVCGKDNWDPVEVGMIEWREGMADNDPALDLKGGRMDGAPQLLRPAHEPVVSYRPVRPMPSRGRLVSRSASTVGIPRQQQHVGTKKATGPDTMAYEQINSPPPPRYGEDEVPLTVQMPGLSSPAVTHRESPQNQKPTLVVGTSTWPQDSNLWDDNEVVVPTASPQRGGSDDSFGSGWSP